jgi:hypothetical protein
VLTTERAARLYTRLSVIAQATDEALAEAAALERLAGPEALHWLPGLVEALGRIQLECVDAAYAARQVKEALPGPEALQHRLI